MPLVIENWDELHERADSRRCKSPGWFSMPSNYPPYRRLTPEGFGVWVSILQAASKCPSRGTLADARGDWSLEDLSLESGVEAEIIGDLWPGFAAVGLVSQREGDITGARFAAEKRGAPAPPAPVTTPKRDSSPPEDVSSPKGPRIPVGGRSSPERPGDASQGGAKGSLEALLDLVPDSLGTDRFFVEFGSWLIWRRTHGHPVTAEWAVEVLDRFERWGPDPSVVAMRNSAQRGVDILEEVRNGEAKPKSKPKPKRKRK